jgi:cell division transport system permease protein
VILRTKFRHFLQRQSVQWVGRDEALKRFKGRLKGRRPCLRGSGLRCCQLHLKSVLKRASRSSEDVDAYVAKLKDIQGIGEIQYGEEWVRRFNTFLDLYADCRWFGWGLSCPGSNLYCLQYHSTYHLCPSGRTGNHVTGGCHPAYSSRCRSCLRGCFKGLLVECLHLLLLLAVHLLFLHNAGNFLTFNPATAGLSFLPPEYIAGLLAAGAMLGFLGSLTALRRFINEITG